MLEPIIKEFAEKICKKRGFHTPYEILIKPELPVDSKGRDRIALIKAGSPPIICISHVYIIACIQEGKISGMPKLRDTIERCLEFLPKMYHTLSLVPIADAVSLRKDSRRWARATVPFLRTELPDKYLKITNISVELTDIITGTSVTKNGLDYNDLVRKAKHDLSKLVIENEEMDEWREMVEEANRVKNLPTNPNEVSITVGETKTETHMEY